VVDDGIRGRGQPVGSGNEADLQVQSDGHGALV
jgi:hypothetical protein